MGTKTKQKPWSLFAVLDNCGFCPPEGGHTTNCVTLLAVLQCLQAIKQLDVPEHWVNKITTTFTNIYAKEQKDRKTEEGFLKGQYKSLPETCIYTQ